MSVEDAGKQVKELRAIYDSVGALTVLVELAQFEEERAADHDRNPAARSFSERTALILWRARDDAMGLLFRKGG